MGELDERPGEVAIDTRLERSGQATIRVSGEVDSANAHSLATAIEEALAQTPEAIVFDFERLRFIDSAGLAVLVRAASSVGAVRLRDPSPIVRRTIEATGLVDVLGLES